MRRLRPIDVAALAATARPAPIGQLVALVVDPRSVAGIVARATLEGWRRDKCSR